jgi:hypothetical protein
MNSNHRHPYRKTLEFSFKRKRLKLDSFNERRLNQLLYQYVVPTFFISVLYSYVSVSLLFSNQQFEGYMLLSPPIVGILCLFFYRREDRKIRIEGTVAALKKSN